VKEPATGWVSSRSAELVTTDQESIESFWISRDGQWLAFDSDRSGTQQIFRRRLAGGDVQQITHGTSPAFYPALSPDGKEVAYHAIVNGLRRIFVASSEGGDQPVQVSPDTFTNEIQSSWSPDGKRLAWWDWQGRVQAVTRSPKGWGVPHEVVSPGAIVFPTWVDSAQLLAADTVHRRLVRVNADSAAGPPRVLMEHREAAPKGLATPIVSSDYRTLYLHNRQGLWLLPLSGAAVTDWALREAVRFDDPLHPHDGFRGVAGYGGFLYFTLQNPQSNIWIARVTGLKR